MNNLQEVTERICELKGSLIALDALLSAMLVEIPDASRGALHAALTAHAEIARTVLLNTPISEHTIAAFERDTARMRKLVEPVVG
ncbi:hypothetical protein [Aquabacterium sp. J223]|uniref:hypothetical protein n=1 Tax=Aquabacterium sp. J223 TaxID=2898431 RepID=UPI0021AE24EC|nr:hypothetical protein [Aquabacterium sp. J223]UUX96936.1 hypothetical protein LRS07_06645 [Aquabacterium sp. J223]